MQRMVDPNNFNELTVFDTMVTAFVFFFRKDNVSVDKADVWNPPGHLCRCDVSFSDSGLVVVIWVRHSKTIQAGERYHTVSAHAVPGSPLCPVAALRRVLAGPGLGPDGPLFCTQDAKVQDSLIQAHGDWASECYKLYCDLDASQRLILPSAMAAGAAAATTAFQARQ
ncbi:hypothetical protein CYMTET_38086 [Cymbomonas tetramitiformis]|uniref:Uncharacterized protein n=1 Tax=Cymbomonas tetramitiformis TaxID=36881 RepID=A0AAE0F6X2_9CHLO|nr:hypothetical protein CYMTET_38086 [Cymbomonas tetramitiformis]